MQPLSKEEVDRILDNNLVDEFDRLGATPGFVLVPMPFEKVHMFIGNEFHGTEIVCSNDAMVAFAMTGPRACKPGNLTVPRTAGSSPSAHQNLQVVQEQGKLLSPHHCRLLHWMFNILPPFSQRLIGICLVCPAKGCVTLSSQTCTGFDGMVKHTRLHSVEGI